MNTTSHDLPARLAEHAPFLRRLARALVRDEHAADDLVSETYLAALAGPMARVASPRAWLATILRRRAAARFERGRRLAAGEVSEDEPERGPSPEDVALALERERVVLGAVERLDEPYRTTIYLRYREGLGGAAIAERMGAPLKTVRTRLHRGLAQLREDLERTSDGRSGGWLSVVVPLAGGARAAGAGMAGLAPKAIGGAAALVAGALLLRGPEPLPPGGAHDTQEAVASRPVADAPAAPAPGVLVEPLDAFEVSEAESSAGLDRRTEAAVGPAGAIEVRVAGGDEGDHAGVPIRIQLTGGSGMPRSPWTVLTNTNGVAVAEGLDAGRYAVSDLRGGETDTLELRPDQRASWTLDLERSRRAFVDVTVAVEDQRGERVPGATVHAVNGSTLEGIYELGRTGANGQMRVTMHGLHYIFATRAGDRRSRMFRVADLVELFDHRSATLVLVEGGARLSGRVLDLEGRPVAGARVTCGDRGFQGGGERGWVAPPAFVETGSDGSFAFDEVFEARVQDVRVLAAGSALWFEKVDLARGGQRIEARVGSGATFTGTLFGHDGAPASNAWVEVLSGHVEADESSTCRSHGVPVVMDGRIEISGLPVPSATLRIRENTRSRDVVVRHLTAEHGQVVAEDVAMEPPPKIGGRVVDAGGRPLEDVLVRVTTAEGRSTGGRMRTDRSGRFVIDDFRLAGRSGELWNVEVVEFGAFEKRLGALTRVEAGSTGLLVVAARPGPARSAFLAGRIPEPRPVGLELILRKRGVDHGVTLSIDEDTGAFRIGPLRPGEFRIEGEWEGAVSTLKSGIRLDPDQTIDVGPLRLDGGGTVTVRPDQEAQRLIEAGVDPSRVRLESVSDGGQTADLRWSEKGAWTRRRPLEAGWWTLRFRWGDGAAMEDQRFLVLEGEGAVIEARLRTRER